MEPGDKLDQLVGQKVFGIQFYYPHAADSSTASSVTSPIEYSPSFYPSYSINIELAWSIIDHLHPDFFNLVWEDDSSGWKCVFGRWELNDVDMTSYEAHGTTPAHAICLAGLKVVGYLENE